MNQIHGQIRRMVWSGAPVTGKLMVNLTGTRIKWGWDNTPILMTMHVRKSRALCTFSSIELAATPVDLPTQPRPAAFQGDLYCGTPHYPFPHSTDTYPHSPDTYPHSPDLQLPKEILHCGTRHDLDVRLDHLLGDDRVVEWPIAPRNLQGSQP